MDELSPDEVPEGDRKMTMRGPGGRIGMAPDAARGVTSKDAINTQKRAIARGKLPKGDDDEDGT